ncbi:hemerythrin domain-containing protein [Catenulispora pinisilvae]|uniref:hemerythrin domain-containing protein n=1 Tax=Catenulispora pinisilvae TaxID=2705253 RepID=UPI0018923AF1|nr:hemerythrin domain-containing protein [Catenulispora pinisilvae]
MSITEDTPDSPGTPDSPDNLDNPDVIAVLRGDHQHVEELFNKVQDHARYRNRRKELADQVIIELVRHMVAEEQYVYPIVREAVGGQAVADHAVSANAAAEALMKQLEPLEATDEVFDRVLIKLMAVTRSHAEDEEAQLFPCLAAACPATELRELGGKVQADKAVRPTRPHPAAVTTPPDNVPVGSEPGLVDRLRDALAHPTEGGY